jgi:hypothetical protein
MYWEYITLLTITSCYIADSARGRRAEKDNVVRQRIVLWIWTASCLSAKNDCGREAFNRGQETTKKMLLGLKGCLRFPDNESENRFPPSYF